VNSIGIKHQHVEVDMNDAPLVNLAAAQYVRGMGSGAIRYLQEMQELAASLSDTDSTRAWCDIEDAALTLLLAVTPDPSLPAPQAELPVPVPPG